MFRHIFLKSFWKFRRLYTFSLNLISLTFKYIWQLHSMNILICYNFRIYIKVLKDFKKGVNIQFYIYFYVRIGGGCVSFKFKDWEQLFGKPLTCSAKRNFQLQILRNLIKKIHFFFYAPQNNYHIYSLRAGFFNNTWSQLKLDYAHFLKKGNLTNHYHDQYRGALND
jgi:hypothetical protein